MKKVSFFLMLLMFCACVDSGKQKVVHEFGAYGELVAEVVPVPVPYLIPRYMGISGDYLLVHKVREEKLFSLFSLPDLTYVADVGIKGQGPDDFNLLDTRSFQMTQDGFHVIDANLNMWKEVEIADKSLKVKTSKQIFGRGMSSNGFYPLWDGRYVTLTQPDSEMEFAIYDMDNGEFCTVESKYPHWQEISKEIPAFMAYIKTCVSHPDGKRFAAFYSRFKRWRLYDESMNMMADVDVQVEPCKADIELDPSEQPVYYIGQPYATNKYIYALCSNRNTEKDGRSELHIWDWEGNPVACYTFDRKLSLIAVSEKYGKIYGIDNQTEDLLFMYKLPL